MLFFDIFFKNCFKYTLKWTNILDKKEIQCIFIIYFYAYHGNPINFFCKHVSELLNVSKLYIKTILAEAKIWHEISVYLRKFSNV